MNTTRIGVSNPNESREPPRVWLLMGHKAGDNSQILALAEALSWQYEIKHMKYWRTELLSNLLLPQTLTGIRRSRSSPLHPPWPNLVITAGRRNEPVARWIRQQSAAACRLVHLGRPWANPQCFDLVITTPQYQIPPAANILLNSLPLHRVNPTRLAAAISEWQPRLAHLPRPYLALLVGGDSGPYVLDQRRVLCLVGEASTMAKKAGGSLLITTSARTPKTAVAALGQVVDVPSYVYRWSPAAKDNPYFGYLGLADGLIVTGESISMLTEACVTRRPVYIFDPGNHPVPLHCSGVGDQPSMTDTRQWWQRFDNYRWKPLTHRLAQKLGPRRMRRDVAIMQRHLVDSGRAVWLGQTFPQGQEPPALNDLERAVSVVKALF